MRKSRFNQAAEGVAVSRSDPLPGAMHESGRCAGFITDLVVRSGHGDEDALGRLVDLFYGPVLEALGRRGLALHGEDHVVEAFVHLWRQAPTFIPGRQGPVEWVMGQVAAWAAHAAPTPAGTASG